MQAGRRDGAAGDGAGADLVRRELRDANRAGIDPGSARAGDERGRHGGRRGVEEALSGGDATEQRHDFLPQFGVAGAAGIEQRRPLAAIAAQCLVEHALDLLPAVAVHALPDLVLDADAGRTPDRVRGR